MRYMMLMIPAGYESAAPGAMPSADAVAEMMAYNRAMKAAGVLKVAEGLHPPSMGTRVTFRRGKPLVTDGPFAEVKEVLGGYWIVEVATHQEAVDWALRCPVSDNATIEIRRIQEAEEFAADQQAAIASMSSRVP